MKSPIVKRIGLFRIQAWAETQSRVALNAEVIGLWAEDMKNGVEFPPVDVFYDGNVSRTYILAEGFHRFHAAKKAELKTILCRIHEGTREDAKWFGYATNQKNGLYRSTADKQRAVEGALKHPKGANLSDRAIARYVGVDRKTVAEWRTRLTGEIPQSVERTGSDGRTIRVSNIGTRKTKTVKITAKAPEFSDSAMPVAGGPEDGENPPYRDIVSYSAFKLHLRSLLDSVRDWTPETEEGLVEDLLQQDNIERIYADFETAMKRLTVVYTKIQQALRPDVERNGGLKMVPKDAGKKAEKKG